MNAVLVPIVLTCVFSLLALRFKTADRDRPRVAVRVACRHVFGICDDDSPAVVLIVSRLSGFAMAGLSQFPD